MIGDEIAAHPASIGRGKRDFEQKVLGWSSRCLRQEHLLVIVENKTRPRHARTASTARCQAEHPAVKIRGLVNIAGINADMRDARDRRPRGLVLSSKGWDEAKADETREQEG